jgi:hypothetical protein
LQLSNLKSEISNLKFREAPTMFEFCVRWFAWGFDTSLKAALVALVAAAVLKLLRMHDSNIRHRVWTGVLAGMLLLPVLTPLMPALRLPLVPRHLVERQAALPEAAQSHSGQTQCAELDDEEVDPGAQRLKKENDPVPERFHAALVGIDHHPDSERQLE